MALHLITGYAGREHITSADQGAYNIATFGAGNFVLDRGMKFAQTVLSNNSIKIADGEAMMQGRFIKMPSGTSEEVSIDNGSQGKYRNDLICIRYEKSTSDATEGASLVVIKGTESTSAATDPTYNNGNITDGDDTIADFPLYRVKLNGISIESVTALFEVKVSMVKYMDDYQLPVATASVLGGVKTGDDISISNDGKISVLKAVNVSSGGTRPVTTGAVYTALTNGTVTKLTGTDVGNEDEPIYLKAGAPKKAKKYVMDYGTNGGIASGTMGVNEVAISNIGDVSNLKYVAAFPMGDTSQNSTVVHIPVVHSFTNDGYIKEMSIISYNTSSTSASKFFRRVGVLKRQ